MDITPHLPAGRRLIESYGAGRFRVGGEVFEGSLLLLPHATLAWPVNRLEEATLATLDPLFAAAAEVELLLLGCGPRMAPPPGDLRSALRERKIALEVMDTGAAARTYNVLLLEERRVAAALVAVD